MNASGVAPILRLSFRGKTHTVATASAAIVIAASALMGVAAYRLAPTAIPDRPLAVIALGSFAALATVRIPPVYIVVVAAVLGVLVSA